MALSELEESLLVGAYFRGGTESTGWTSNSDQIVALSLFYTGDITFHECQKRFMHKCVDNYNNQMQLKPDVRTRYRQLLDLVENHPDLMEAAGDIVTPADPTYTSCRLTAEGTKIALTLIDKFSPKPEFPNWPDKRTYPQADG